MIKSNLFDYPAGWRRRTAMMLAFPLGLLIHTIAVVWVFVANGWHEARKIYPEFFGNMRKAWNNED